MGRGQEEAVWIHMLATLYPHWGGEIHHSGSVAHQSCLVRSNLIFDGVDERHDGAFSRTVQ